MITARQSEIIKSATQKVNPKMVAIFGSYARGEENPQSVNQDALVRLF